MKWLRGDENKKNKEAVKLRQLKLQFGVLGAKFDADKVSIEITATSSSSSSSSTQFPKLPSIPLIPFHRTGKGRRCCSSTHTTPPRPFLSSKSPSVTWDARDLSPFLFHLNDPSFHFSFHVLYGQSSGKMAVVGKASTTVTVAKEEEMMKARSTNSSVDTKLPIKLKVNGLCIEATLSVSMRVMSNNNNKKEKNSKEDSARRRAESKKKGGILWRVKHLRRTSSTQENDRKHWNESQGRSSPYESDGVFDSDDSSNDSTTSSGSGSSSSTGTTSFKGWGGFAAKQLVSITHSHPSAKSWGQSLQSHLQDKNNLSPTSRWKTKEIWSRDRQAKLKTSVFFASFDQRSEQASGHSACTVLVALIAHWLHSNKDTMPTRSQFDTLITQGSKEWRKLCNTDHYLNLFPDKHFDLETIIEANLRPLIVLPQESYTGFFSPEKFCCLKGAMSFDEIWDEINKKTVADGEPRIYIVSWNDHFFVLKVEANACYVIDSLGERLFEGCKQGFMIRFDESSVMYGKEDRGTSSEVVCRGKECCREFIKRFLAAIPLCQLDKEEKKGNVSSLWVHRQLQIEFHYSISLS